MKILIKSDIHITNRVILQENLEKLDIPYYTNSLGKLEIREELSPNLYKKLETALKRYGIEIINDPKESMVQQIKDIIMEVVYSDEETRVNMSTYIADKMNLSYGHLSKIFSEETFTSIKNYIILMRIERVKQLIIEHKMTFSEVAWKLNYSSIAHLSNQFKKITGLTPTLFLEIIERRNEYQETLNQPNGVNSSQKVNANIHADVI
jgi:AraC-like DNA-binding protein